MKALILQNKVVQLSEVEFEVHKNLTWLNVEEGVAVDVGWSFEDGIFVNPDKRTVEQIAADNLDLLRSKRNKKLAETDFWALSDTGEMTQAQKDYRQALRNITETYSSLENVVWPNKPE
jgi:hypothetical protein